MKCFSHWLKVTDQMEQVFRDLLKYAKECLISMDKDEARTFWVSSVLISIAIGTLFWLLIFSLKSWWRCSIAALVEFSKDRSAIAEKKWKRFESAGLSSERQWQFHRQIVSYRIRSSLEKPIPALQQPFSRDLEFDPDLYQSIGKSCASHLPVGVVLHERSLRGPWGNGRQVSRWVELWFFLSHILVASKKHRLWLLISNVHEIKVCVQRTLFAKDPCFWFCRSSQLSGRKTWNLQPPLHLHRSRLGDSLQVKSSSTELEHSIPIGRWISPPQQKKKKIPVPVPIHSFLPRV